MSHRGYPITQQMRVERRAVAEARNAEYAKLSLEEKLARLPADGAKKQRAKLEKLLKAKEDKAKQASAKEDKPAKK